MSVLMGNTIDSNGPFNRSNVRVGQSSGRIDLTAGPAEPRATGSASGDHVQFSDSVALLQRVQSRIDAEPTIDKSRVAAARMAIANGSYQIDHSQIASTLLAMDKELP